MFAKYVLLVQALFFHFNSKTLVWLPVRLTFTRLIKYATNAINHAWNAQVRLNSAQNARVELSYLGLLVLTFVQTTTTQIHHKIYVYPAKAHVQPAN